MTTSIILTDDWEVRGNGSGNVADLQVKPAKRLMDIYEKHGIRSTFNVEVLHQLSSLKFCHLSRRMASDVVLWENSVHEMLDRDFDVQLHLHPQWWKASFKHGNWELGKKWNIVDYSKDEIFEMVENAVSYLKSTFSPKLHLCAFRAGSWGAAPKSRHLQDALRANDIFVDVSMCAGIKYSGDCIELDYSHLESPYLPYFADRDDFRKIAQKNATGFMCIPTQSVPYTIETFSGMLKYEAYGGANFKNTFRDLKLNIEGRVKGRFQPEIGKPKFKQSFGIENAPVDPFGFASNRAKEDAIMDLSGNRNYKTFRLLVDIIIKRHQDVKKEKFQDVLLFENHTKDLQTDQKFADIEALIRYIKSAYPQHEFTTLSGYITRHAFET